LVSVDTETNGTIPVITKKLIGHVDNSADTNIAVNIELNLARPPMPPRPFP